MKVAGIDPKSLRGSDTGVFAGACYSGYTERVTGELEGYRLTGTTHSVLRNAGLAACARYSEPMRGQLSCRAGR
ncbi:beta-ketoacyl synthase N-terminal-like domain-containing protein [Nocardia cyriacigeorgica]|uniref:beta-ketoacyl synthase N-terminal-like domain-containing protein n=1 Tax=Nocardia cyriacigeorgica TaxID=135487 RepID=UPI003CC7D65E